MISVTDVLRYCLWAWTVRHVKTTTDVAVVGADAKRFGFEIGTRGYAGTMAGQLQEAFRERVRRGIVRTSSLYTHAKRLREQLGEGATGSPEGGGTSGTDDKDETEAQIEQVSRHGGSAIEMRLVQAMEAEALEEGGEGSGASHDGAGGPLHEAAQAIHADASHGDAGGGQHSAGGGY